MKNLDNDKHIFQTWKNHWIWKKKKGQSHGNISLQKSWILFFAWDIPSKNYTLLRLLHVLYVLCCMTKCQAVSPWGLSHWTARSNLGNSRGWHLRCWACHNTCQHWQVDHVCGKVHFYKKKKSIVPTLALIFFFSNCCSWSGEDFIDSVLG